MLYDLVGDLRVPPGSSVLDVCCGEGRHTLKLATRCGFVVRGIDPVERHMELANAELAAAVDHPELREQAIAAAGLRIDECLELGTERGEYAEEKSGKASRQLLHGARLLRDPGRYIAQYARLANRVR